jgi:alpha-methylacyl-CoA racemase
MGPLAGVKVIEIAGLGTAPYGCMMLADMGADVVRIDRTDGRGGTPQTVEHHWPALKRELSAIFRDRSRDEWCALFADSDVCVTPVLTLKEAAAHPHNRARNAFIDVGGVQQNAPAPRFSRTVPAHPRAPPKTGSDAERVLADWGVDLKLLSSI